MKVVVAIDSFKGSLSSYDLGNQIEKGVKKIYPESEIVKLPIADGGEGTVEALVEGSDGEFVKVRVVGPLGDKIEAEYGIINDGKIAVIEMAAASGLPLVKPEERNPMKATTYGTGELIRDAIEKGCREFIIGIGGSATNDAGIGMAQALGYKFYDENGEELGYGGEMMERVVDIQTLDVIPEIKECNFQIACDVDNVLYGERGAAYVYGKQKGADDIMIKELDRGLRVVAETFKQKLGKDIAGKAGAGAAGGLGAGFLAFTDAVLKPGIDIILSEVEFEKKLSGADFVITGEGRIDFQSVMGKAPIGVSKLAEKNGVPCIAIGGCIADDAGETHKYGISSLFSIINYPISLEEAMNSEKAKIFVEKNIEEIFSLIKVCEYKYSR